MSISLTRKEAFFDGLLRELGRVENSVNILSDFLHPYYKKIYGRYTEWTDSNSWEEYQPNEDKVKVELREANGRMIALVSELRHRLEEINTERIFHNLGDMEETELIQRYLELVEQKSVDITELLK